MNTISDSLLFNAISFNSVVFYNTVFAVLQIDSEKIIFQNIVCYGYMMAVVNLYPARIAKSSISGAFYLKSLEKHMACLNRNHLKIFLAVEAWIFKANQCH